MVIDVETYSGRSSGRRVVAAPGAVGSDPRVARAAPFLGAHSTCITSDARWMTPAAGLTPRDRDPRPPRSRLRRPRMPCRTLVEACACGRTTRAGPQGCWPRGWRKFSTRPPIPPTAPRGTRRGRAHAGRARWWTTSSSCTSVRAPVLTRLRRRAHAARGRRPDHASDRQAYSCGGDHGQRIEGPADRLGRPVQQAGDVHGAARALLSSTRATPATSTSRRGDPAHAPAGGQTTMRRSGPARLMLLHHARRPAGPAGGRLVPRRAGPGRWNTACRRGRRRAPDSPHPRRLGEFQARRHRRAPRRRPYVEETDWVQIVEWYDELVRLTTAGGPPQPGRRVGEADGRGRPGRLAGLDPPCPPRRRRGVPTRA